ncbi:MAG: hypothetical protein WCL02_03955 [bacterium]
MSGTGQDYDTNAIIGESIFEQKNTPTTFDFTPYGIATLEEWIQYPELNQ